MNIKKIIKKILILLLTLVIIGLGFVRYKGLKSNAISLKKSAYAPNSSVSCLKNDQYEYKKVGYKKCDVEFNSKDWYTEVRPDQGTNTVVMYIEGGPSLGHDYKENSFVTGVMKKHQLLYLKNIFHMKSPVALFKKHNVKNAIKEMEEYYTILEKLIKEQQALNKKVVLVGHSFGSFVVNKFLQTKGTLADMHVSVGTRISYGIDTKKELTATRNKLFPGAYYRFDWNNEKYKQVKTYQLSLAKLMGQESGFYFIMSYMLATGTFSLDEWDKSKIEKGKVIFVTSAVDNNLGALSQKEKDFATSVGYHIEYSKEDIQNSYPAFYKTDAEMSSKRKTKPADATEKDWLLAGHYTPLSGTEFNNRWEEIVEKELNK